MRDTFADRKTEYEELKSKLKAYSEETFRISKRIRTAFPHIEQGKYRNIFKQK